ncbi:S-antigen protein [Smittium mucronatum]|uniref:S-antigen protein n=1 Tax=Smittium mucronatum TaxID=133383 RepID=A0A1R0GPM7_9FUNG|nr:S-antigen protein [Smittium mucronatum]
MKIFNALAFIKIILLSINCVQSLNSKSIINDLKKNYVIPNVIPRSFTPLTELKLIYANRDVGFGKDNFSIFDGSENSPQVSYISNSTDYYTLAFLGENEIDRSNKYSSQFIYYLRINIKGSNLSTGSNENLKYFSPNPFKVCSKTTLVFVLARQQGELSKSGIPTTRFDFSIARFTDDNNMQIIGANYINFEPPHSFDCNSNTKPTLYKDNKYRSISYSQFHSLKNSKNLKTNEARTQYTTKLHKQNYSNSDNRNNPNFGNKNNSEYYYIKNQVHINANNPNHQGRNNLKFRDNDGTESRNNDRTESRNNDRTESRNNDHTESRNNDRTESRNNDRTESRNNDHTESRNNDRTESHNNDCTESRNNDCTESRNNDRTESRNNDRTESRYNDCTETNTTGETELNNGDQTNSNSNIRSLSDITSSTSSSSVSVSRSSQTNIPSSAFKIFSGVSLIFTIISSSFTLGFLII